MDQEDLEEGEISDSDEETKTPSAPPAYTPLPRPTNPAMSYRVPQEALGLPPAHTFRESPAGHAAQDSDADSEVSDEDVSEKRPRLESDVASQASTKKRSVWSDVLLEQQISSRIGSGAITSDDIDTVERGVESYRPSGESRTVAIEEFEKKQEAHGELWDVTEDGESLDTVRKRVGKKKKRKVKDRLDLEYADEFDDYHDYLPEEVCADDDERVIARYIARNLNEPKIVLVERVTRFAGRKKALELFNATMDIEAAGGLMTIRGDTRRTPGGVFLQLLKKDKDVTKETVNDIFAVERDNQKFAKKVFVKERQIRKRKYYGKVTNEDEAMTSTSAAADEFELMEEPDIEIGVVTS